MAYPSQCVLKAPVALPGTDISMRCYCILKLALCKYVTDFKGYTIYDYIVLRRSLGSQTSQSLSA